MRRKILTVLSLLYALLVLYNTFIPFSFHASWSGLQVQLHHIAWELPVLGAPQMSLTDWIGNILLFIPFGFLGYLLLHERGWACPLIASVIAGAVFSGFIEGMQLLTPLRHTALHDWANNVVGSGAGAAVAAVYRCTMTSAVRERVYRVLRRQPFWCILIAFGIGQGVVALMPFTVSMKVSDLKRSVYSANVVPFDYQPISQLIFHRPNPHGQKPFDRMQFAEQLLFWAPLGYVLVLCRRLHRRGWRLVVLLPIVYFPTLEFLQLFIISHVTDINNVLSGYLGIACGTGLCRLLHRVRWSANRLSPEGLYVPLCLYGVFVVFTGLQPFDWVVVPEARAWNLRWSYLVPFYSYYGHTSLSNLSELLGSLTILLPITLYAGYRRRQQGDTWFLIFAGATLASLLIGLATEGLHLLSPSRTGDITDVLAYSSSGVLGASLLYYYEQEIQPAFATLTASVANVHTGSAL